MHSLATVEAAARSSDQLAQALLEYACSCFRTTGQHIQATLVAACSDDRKFWLTIKRFGNDVVQRRDYVAHIVQREAVVAYAYASQVTIWSEAGDGRPALQIVSTDRNGGVVRIYRVEPSPADPPLVLESQSESTELWHPYLGLLDSGEASEEHAAEYDNLWKSDRADPDCCRWENGEDAQIVAQRERRRLMGETGKLRSQRFPSASDEAWRRERLFRYLYWREHRDHCPFNLVGAWEIQQIQAELARWQDYQRRDLSEEEVLELICSELEQRHGKTWRQALEEGTSPLLASVGMPVWNEGTGSLLPGSLGPLPICRAESSSDRPDLGWQYHYEGTLEKVSLAIYDFRMEGLGDGVGDSRLAGHFKMCCQDIARMASANGGVLVPGSAVGPALEVLNDSVGHQIKLVGTYIEVDYANGVRRGEALSMRTFRHHFLKVRYSLYNAADGIESAQPRIDAINADVAEFVGHFT